MDWPSTRVAQGGLFHTPKARYTKETQDLIKVLMEEAKLTILQRNKINYHLRNGEPLPVPKEPKFEQEYSNFLPMAIPRKNIKKRSLNTIIESGAFDVEKYVPHKPKEPIEKLKLKLQEQMSGIKMFPDDGRRRRVVRSKSEGCMEFVPPDRASERKLRHSIAFDGSRWVIIVFRLPCSTRRNQRTCAVVGGDGGTGRREEASGHHSAADSGKAERTEAARSGKIAGKRNLTHAPSAGIFKFIFFSFYIKFITRLILQQNYSVVATCMFDRQALRKHTIRCFSLTHM
ncbi:uncharacterized protein LOC118509136 isoform X1 [Anopheles stephensi]|uniref:uncharacterized protein LOC118509136 isoform X1 n=1 Tax=Anopheles stephensi TaxID=30069 RepID=UPI001658874D|nr:uncharacterized protein LOC118509136 isoform X1 [Anopheles stephensi]